MSDLLNLHMCYKEGGEKSTTIRLKWPIPDTSAGRGRVTVTAQVGVIISKIAGNFENMQAYLSDVGPAGCPISDTSDAYVYGYFFTDASAPSGSYYRNGIVQRIFDFDNGSSSVTRRYYLNYLGSDTSTDDFVYFWSGSLHGHYTPVR